MTYAEYRRRTLKDLQKGLWRTQRVIRNGNLEVPIGTVVEITYKMKGLTIQTDPCKHCGVRIFVSRVEPTALEEI